MLRTPYRQVSRAMSGTGVAPAESHGYLCGALCVSTAYTFERWLDELGRDQLDGHVMSDDTSTAAQEYLDPRFAGAGRKDPILTELYDDTVQSLRNDAAEFVPLLPDDDTPLIERTRALAQWCQGFLYGFASVQPDSQAGFGADIREVLGDFAEISRVDVGNTAHAADISVKESDENTDEEDEIAYMELFEFIRIGVQLVHAELSRELP